MGHGAPSTGRGGVERPSAGASLRPMRAAAGRYGAGQRGGRDASAVGALGQIPAAARSCPARVTSYTLGTCRMARISTGNRPASGSCRVYVCRTRCS